MRRTVAALAILSFAFGWLPCLAPFADGAGDAPAICAGGPGPASPAAGPRMDFARCFGPAERLAPVTVDAPGPERLPRVLWFAQGGERPGFGSPLEHPPRASA